MDILEINNLTYCYPGAARPALQQICLRIGKGECVALLGAGRSGKTTLCYALAGIVPHYYRGAFSGSVFVNGRETTGYPLSELSRHVGLVMQHPARQLSGMRFTVFEEVAFGLENLGTPRDRIEQQVNATLSRVGLTGKAASSPLQLSGGQQQRLAIATVLAVAPQILVLDEPTTFLDPQGAEMIFGVLEQLRHEGTTIVLAGQNMEWIAEHADRAMVLAEGAIIREGRPDDVLTSAELAVGGIDWMRITRAGYLGRQQQVWPASKPLPVTVKQAAAGFSCERKRA